MTDKEIIKALKCCGSEVATRLTCQECPMGGKRDCMTYLYRQALALINRQKAEISELQHKIMSCNSEIERLISNIEAMAQSMPTMAKADRAEAVKEFAERLKKHTTTLFDWSEVVEISVDDLDDLVEEMVGEGN